MRDIIGEATIEEAMTKSNLTATATAAIRAAVAGRQQRRTGSGGTARTAGGARVARSSGGRGSERGRESIAAMKRRARAQLKVDGPEPRMEGLGGVEVEPLSKLVISRQGAVAPTETSASQLHVLPKDDAGAEATMAAAVAEVAAVIATRDERRFAGASADEFTTGPGHVITTTTAARSDGVSSAQPTAACHAGPNFTSSPVLVRFDLDLLSLD